MKFISGLLQHLIRWVRLLGSPRPLARTVTDSTFISNSRRTPMNHGVTSPIIVRYTFRVRLIPIPSGTLTTKTRN